MSNGMRTLVLALMLAIGLSSGNMAVAAIIPVDDAVFGIGSITRDTGTGLDWLDLTLSSGRSFNDVNSQFGVGGDFEGFRYATETELGQLFTNAGITPIDSTFTVSNAAPVLELMTLMGILDLSFNKRSFILTSTMSTPGTHFAGLLEWKFEIDDDFPLGRATTRRLSFPDTSTDIRLGSGLVHTTPTSVPEPATSVLLLSGLAMVGLAMRKRDREKRRSSRL